MKKNAFSAIVLLGIGLGLCVPAIVHANYTEECLREGCNTEEVMELYQSYQEECLQEGCNQEEIFELGGTDLGVQAMLQDFRNRGLRVRPQDQGAGHPTCTGTTETWYGPVAICDDHCTFPDGTHSSPYVCGFIWSWW